LLNWSQPEDDLGALAFVATVVFLVNAILYLLFLKLLLKHSQKKSCLAFLRPLKKASSNIEEIIYLN
jgi:hypothetical protein